MRKNPELKQARTIEPRNYVCGLTLQKAIQKIYPDGEGTYPHGPAGTLFKDGSFVSFNGRVGTVIYAYCDFTDKKKVPLSKTNMDDLTRLGLLNIKDT